MNFKKFKIEAIHNGRAYRVYGKGWFNYYFSGYVYTDYFEMSYPTLIDAIEAIDKYKNRNSFL